MSKGRASGETAAGSAVPDIYIDSYETEETGEFSHGTQPVASAGRDEDEGTDNIGGSDWLMEATVDLNQDLDTSKKELDIIKFILQEMEVRPRTDHRPNLTREGEVELMKACWEYSSFRCDLLRKRLRQVQFWAHARMLGQQVPEKAPEEVSGLFSQSTSSTARRQLGRQQLFQCVMIVWISPLSTTRPLPR